MKKPYVPEIKKYDFFKRFAKKRNETKAVYTKKYIKEKVNRITILLIQLKRGVMSALKWTEKKFDEVMVVAIDKYLDKFGFAFTAFMMLIIIIFLVLWWIK